MCLLDYETVVKRKTVLNEMGNIKNDMRKEEVFFFLSLSFNKFLSNNEIPFFLLLSPPTKKGSG